MQSLIREIDSVGYDAALQNLYRKYPYLSDYVSDIRRSDWLCHCIGKSKVRCLDIGSGLGNLCEMLSYHFESVYSLEAVRERIQFQVRRFNHSKRSNITIARGNALELPFQDNYFDLVVCNGVLEWVGSMNTTRSPRQGQLSFLKEIRRVLSHSGCLYIGIENRFGLWFLLGAKDHSGLRYTSIIPRKLADILVRKYANAGGIYGDKGKRRKEEKGYFEYTYSKWGYKDLLQQAGYKVKPYWVYPSYNSPFFSGRLEDNIGLKGFVRYLKSNDSKHKSLLSLLEKTNNSILGFFAGLVTPSFLFFCYKDSFNEVLDDIILKNSMLNHYTVISGGHTIMYLLYNKDGKPEKIAHLKRYNYELPATIPSRDKIHLEKYDSSQRVWMESWFPGHKLNPLNSSEVQMAVEWLFDFQKKTRGQLMAEDDINTETDSIKAGLSEIADFDTLQNYTRLDNYRSYVTNLSFHKTAEHGDFWYGNVLVDPNTRKLNVIDWEYFQGTGNPLYDLLFFFLNGMLYPADSEQEFIKNLNDNGKFVVIMKELRNSIHSHFGFDLDVLKLLPYVILRFVVTKSRERIKKDKTIINYDKMLEKHKRLLSILAEYN